MKVAVMEAMEEIRYENIQPDEDGSYLKELQRLVRGNIEAFDVLYGNQPLLWVNESGILEGMIPNRAVYANQRMKERKYLSMMDMETPIKKGKLYTILFGPIVACSYEVNEEGERVMRDLTPEEMSRLEDDFWNENSGIEEALKLRIMAMNRSSQERGSHA